LDQRGVDGFSLSLTPALSRRRERETLPHAGSIGSLSHLWERVRVRGKQLKT